MKKIIAVLIVVFAPFFVYGDAERLDLLKETVINYPKFTLEKGYYSTGAEMIDTTEADPVCVEAAFPEKCSIVKIFILTGKTKVTSNLNGVREVSTMYNFVVEAKTQYGDFKEIRKFMNNTVTKIEIKEKVKTDCIRIRVLPYREGSAKCFGDMSFEVWGYKGDEPKQEKIKIKTKADAKKAFKLNEITAKEYMQFLKDLTE